MNRRSFFRLLAGAVVAAPAIPAILAEAAAAPVRWVRRGWLDTATVPYPLAEAMRERLERELMRPSLFEHFLKTGAGPGDTVTVTRVAPIPPPKFSWEFERDA